MPLYQLAADAIEPVVTTTFAAAGLRERQHLQALLRQRIDVIAPDTLVIAEEFGEWTDGRRRIDLLGIDRLGNLVVIELKRTEDGGHMELQAIRYAAMVAAMTFDRAVDIFQQFLESQGADADARSGLLDFLGWDEPDEEHFAQDVRIVLASAEFSRELTTSVLWLNEHGLDIRCVRMRPFEHAGQVLIDIQPIIPLPEVEDYQVRVRDKARLEQAARATGRDFTRFDVVVGGETFSNLPKRRAVHRVIKSLCDNGVSPQRIEAVLPWKTDLFRHFPGTLDSASVREQLLEQLRSEGRKEETGRHFIDDDELIHWGEQTSALTKMWGTRTAEAIGILLQEYPDRGVSCAEQPR
ncbi:hypothetical protein [Panacagrimonas sp.]|uniref:hypothetical protein n=1 Tax=Panacagrimonas sp. TaxID=2480088 RepID=UPI003B517BDF